MIVAVPNRSAALRILPSGSAEAKASLRRRSAGADSGGAGCGRCVEMRATPRTRTEIIAELKDDTSPPPRHS